MALGYSLFRMVPFLSTMGQTAYKSLTQSFNWLKSKAYMSFYLLRTTGTLCHSRTPLVLAIIYLTTTVGLDQALDPCIFLIMTLGGMDTYVRQFGLQTHDEFYTNPSILTSFLNYTTQVVSRYVNSPSVFSYELANDARYVMAYISEPLSSIHFIQVQLYLASICYLHDRNDHGLACNGSCAHPQH